MRSGELMFALRARIRCVGCCLASTGDMSIAVEVPIGSQELHLAHLMHSGPILLIKNNSFIQFLLILLISNLKFCSQHAMPLAATDSCP